MDLIVDLETLGLRENTVVVSLGAVVFDMEKPQSFGDLVRGGFEVKFSISEQLQVYNRTITESTMEWWEQQSDAAKAILKRSDQDMRMSDGLLAFNSWLLRTGYDFKNSYVWSRGTYFDFPKLEHMFEQANIKCGYNSWKIRDVRTMIDVLTGNSWGKYDPVNGTPQEFIPHNALHDAAMDAYRMTEIFQRAGE